MKYEGTTHVREFRRRRVPLEEITYERNYAWRGGVLTSKEGYTRRGLHRGGLDTERIQVKKIDLGETIGRRNAYGKGERQKLEKIG